MIDVSLACHNRGDEKLLKQLRECVLYIFSNLSIKTEKRPLREYPMEGSQVVC